MEYKKTKIIGPWNLSTLLQDKQMYGNLMSGWKTLFARESSRERKVREVAL